MSGQTKIWDFEMAILNKKVCLIIYDSLYNLHIFNIQKEKNKLKKVADMYLPQLTKMISFNNSIFLATAYGAVYQVNYVPDDQLATYENLYQTALK
jgi:hypothetical protein